MEKNQKTVAFNPVPLGFVRHSLPAVYHGYQPETLVFVNHYEDIVPIDIRVQKVIVENESIPHPDSIEVQLYHDSAPVGSAVTLSDDNQWQHTWPGLDSDSQWTVDEVSVPAGYVKKITGSAEDGFTITDSPSIRQDTLVIQGQKTWNHGSNPQARQPQEITVYVKRGEFVAAQKKVTPQDGWRYSFEVPKFDADGNEIAYTIEEKPVAEYTAKVQGYNISNTFTSAHSPKTNDDTKLWAWTCLFMLCAAGMLALFAARRHFQRQRRVAEIQRKLVYWRKAPKNRAGTWRGY